MALLPVLIAPDPRLKLKAKPIAPVDSTIPRLLDDMLETMYVAPAIGLAAPPMPGAAMKLRLAFMGTPDFAVPILAALLAAGHDIAAVYCQPPRPSGRGHRTQPSPVHHFAAARGLEVRHPVSLRTAEAQAEFAALALDIAVVAAHWLILPKPILAAPRLGCVNVHASLLPRWRGAAPIQRAILAGDSAT